MTGGNFFVSVDDILEEWEKDSRLDRSDMAGESLKVPQLHSKYIKYHRHAKRTLRGVQAEMKRLKLDKREFYTKGASKETRARGWRPAPQGLLAKDEAQLYIEADPELQEMTEKLGTAEDTVAVLDEILKTIHNRSFHISNALGWEKFLAGLDK